MANYVVIIACVLVIALGQSLFKAVGNRLGSESLLYLFEDKIAALMLFAALASYGVSTIGWVWALRQVPLSTAYLFMSISFIIVPISAYWFFKEPLTIQYAFGVVLIISGIFVASTA